MTLYYVKTNLVNVTSLPEDDATHRSSEDTVYQVERLYNKRPSYPFRFDGVNAQWVKVGFDAAAQQITFLGIFNHNFIEGTLAITLNGDIAIGAGFANLVSTPVWRAENMYALFDGTWKWWKLNIDNGAATKAQMGELVLGNWAKFDNAYVQPGRADGPVIHASNNITHYGQDWTAYYSRGEMFSIALKNINDPSATDDIQAFLNDIWEDNDGKFVFIPDHTQPKVYYVQVVNRDSYANRLINGVSELREWRLELKTLTEGITLL